MSDYLTKKIAPVEFDGVIIKKFNTFNEVYEVVYNWTIPDYQIGKTYSEKIKLTDEVFW